ncbi:hypothetical protein ACPOL_3384 [Acidisarcina polymorpha]|uniref:Uncharacterized protein n=1 Tax=Acidisarcina polymorpha TaxID=2211140 RepID=A0A2Z5G0H8_9BACT|nr:hypothetical protein [Acidisarcina polymorpha]AXC12673.1 hypothetical protein ACPOL_3384 [Acidisarcina polymorpha]
MSEGLRNRSVLLLILFAVTRCLGQIHLPGGITVTDPRQQGRPNRPVNPRGNVGRPDPDKVCPQMESWLQSLSKEYPGVDLAHTVSDKIQQMAIPLFADDPFQKQFGVSYSKLSDEDRKQFFSTHVIPCQTSRQYAQQTIVLQVFGSAFRPASASVGPLSPNQLVPALDRLASARAALQKDEQLLQSMQPTAETSDQAASLQEKRKDELARVWPSEKTQFLASVKDAITRSAEPALEAHLKPLLSAPASPESAGQLKDAPRKYAALFQAVPAEQRSALEAKLADRRSQVLREMLPPQQAKADSFPATRQGLDDGAEWFSAFQSVFLDPPAIPEAVSLAKSYITRREATLAKMAPRFRQTIETTGDPESVAFLFDDVFRLQDDRETDVYRQLVVARTARAEILTRKAELARRAEEEKAEQAALRRGDIVASSLKTADLANAVLFRALYTGDFAHSGIERANVIFVDMFAGYLETYGKSCPANLPADKVEMSVKECARSQHLVNGYGLQVSPDTCIEWRRRPIGVYADPRAFAAKVDLEDAAQRNGMRSFLQVLGSKDPVGDTAGQMKDMIGSSISLSRDIPKLIAENGCTSKALARLQENLTRFATGEDPVHLSGYVPDASKATSAQNLDTHSLADDLIRANAAGWLMNQYLGLESVKVDDQLDTQGRPRHIHATYDQKGVTRQGAVEIAFVDGVPSCLYFEDDPDNCKAPNPSIVRRYENGEYRKKSGR